MSKESHIIFGVEPTTDEKVRLLKKDGQKLIYIVDYNQVSEVKEIKGVVHLSPKIAATFIKNDPTTVCHFFMRIPPGSEKEKQHK